MDDIFDSTVIIREPGGVPEQDIRIEVPEGWEVIIEPGEGVPDEVKKDDNWVEEETGV